MLTLCRCLRIEYCLEGLLVVSLSHWLELKTPKLANTERVLFLRHEKGIKLKSALAMEVC